MSIATWHVVFVHPEENFKAPRRLYETAKKALERLASPGYECNEDGSSSAYFRPNEPDRPINQLQNDLIDRAVVLR